MAGKPTHPTVSVTLNIKTGAVTLAPTTVTIEPGVKDDITWGPALCTDSFTFCTLEFLDKVHPFTILSVDPKQIKVDDDNQRTRDYGYVIWVHGADNKRYSTKSLFDPTGPTIKNK